MFDVYLTEESVAETDSGVQAVYGKIRIGDFSETFTASMARWSTSQYELHWIAALQRILDGAGRSVLITSYVDPFPEGFLFCWPLYRGGETIHVQNRLLFFDQLLAPFDPNHPWDSIHARRTTNDEGQRISEWTTDVDSIRECAARKRRRL